MIVQYLFFSFLLYSALALTDPQLINAFYFPLMARASPGLHRPFMFNLRTKHFTSNVTRQAFGGPECTTVRSDFFQRHLNRETYTEVGECVITRRITHNVSEASSEDGVGGRAGGWNRRSLGCSLIWPPWSALWTRTRDWQRAQRLNPLLSDAKEALKAATWGQWTWHLRG